jgi:uncharacterized protein YukE
MFVYFGGLVGGKLSKFSVKFTQKAPFFEMSNGGIPKDAFKQYEDFVDYGKFLHEALTEKIPKLLQQAKEYPEKAKTIKEEAGPAIQALDTFKKPQAVVNIGFNIAELAKVPEFFQKSADQVKKDLEELKETVEEIKNKIKEYDEKAKKANDDKKCSSAPEAYQHVYGSITYSAAERSKWEKWVASVCRKNQKTFNPSDYPKTNQTA